MQPRRRLNTNQLNNNPILINIIMFDKGRFISTQQVYNADHRFTSSILKDIITDILSRQLVQ